MAEAVARASRESLRTGGMAVKGGAMAMWGNSGARMPTTAVRAKTTHTGDDLALLRFRPANDSASSLVSFDSEAQPQACNPSLKLLSTMICGSVRFSSEVSKLELHWKNDEIFLVEFFHLW